MKFEEILQLDLYNLEQKKKEKYLTERLKYLTKYHMDRCSDYNKMLNCMNYNEKRVSSYTDLPFLPVRLFKERALKSVPDHEIVKIMTSSGTSGQNTSKIYLDRTTAANQQKAMVKIVSEFTGSSRMPMVILDCPSVVKDRRMFSARGAGILGFSIFGTKKIYALDDDMRLNLSELKEFLETYKDKKIFLFGFTFMIWQHFYKELVRLRDETGEMVDLSNAVLIHGGGWKKLISEAVSPEEFHSKLHDICGLNAVHDYYGMVEQTGCIYMQCECGHFHASIFSDVIIRRPDDFSVADIGEKGIVQVVSTIPESYPGHSLLTEDMGVILGEDDCPCGRKGKYFKIFGRLKNAEIRGCSDTYALDYNKRDCDVSAYKKADKSDTLDEILNGITYLVGDVCTLRKMPLVQPLPAFDEKVFAFLDDLSKELMKNPAAKVFPDIVSLGFWLRRSSVSALKQRFDLNDGNIHIGRGVVFHVAPSNVPVNFAYSLFTGLLLGNANLVRVPSKDFPQVRIINAAIEKVLNIHQEIQQYICLIRYDRNAVVNDRLSSMCDVRIIWGGDTTIAELRKSPLPPRSTDITFADRYSLAVIDSDAYMEMVKDDVMRNRIAIDFYNDTYLSDQNACTSPKLIAWTGTRRAKAKEIFWTSISSLVKNKYQFQPIMGIDKLSQVCLAATAVEDIGMIKILPHDDNKLIKIQVSRLSAELMNHRGNCGYFYEYDFEDVMELHDFCNNAHCQTIGIIGNRDIVKPLILSGIKGVDRVVPIGHTMDFDLNWDGYNLAERLTRTVVI